MQYSCSYYTIYSIISDVVKTTVWKFFKGKERLVDQPLEEFHDGGNKALQFLSEVMCGVLHIRQMMQGILHGIDPLHQSVGIQFFQ